LRQVVTGGRGLDDDPGHRFLQQQNSSNFGPKI